MKRISSSLILSLLLSGALLAQAPAPAPDNTKTNKQDSAGQKPTADQQTNKRSDVDITKDIRQAITKDKTLSTYGKNIKIITQNGNVLLRGPVHSVDEKNAIEAKAKEVAGASNVKSEIEITPTKAEKSKS